MISILIPVFNRDVFALVRILSEQLVRLDKAGEIIVMDDGSDELYANIEVAGLPFVQYIETGINSGRIRIRQMLADRASCNWLLFLDCDSMVVSDQFLKTYYGKLTGSDTVIAGGRIYSPEKPADCRYMLHWKYGTNREVIKEAGNKHINRFMTNNVLIHKSVFENFDFNGGWNTYGYEDTWMSIQLEAMNVPVIFTNNPVLHDGVETSTVFMKKSEEALRNLKRLSNIVTHDNLIQHVKLYKYYYRMHAWRLMWVVRLFCFTFRKYINRNLQSCKPSLLLFDLHRLNYFGYDH